MSNTLFYRTEDAVITHSDIQRLIQKYERMTADINALMAERASVESKIRAAEILTDRKFLPTPGSSKPETEPSPPKPETMVDAIERIVTESHSPLSHPQIMKRLKEVPEFRERLQNNANYYYTAVIRLQKRGRIEKAGKATFRKPLTTTPSA